MLGIDRKQKMPPLQFSQADFDKLTDALAFESQHAVIDYRMYRDLAKAAEDNEIVVNQSRAFWEMTIDAHLNSAMLRLCRIYDQQASAMSLLKWLKLIKQNSKWLRDPVDPNQLKEDIEYVSKKNTKVDSLTKYRGHVVAHLGAKYVLNFRNTRASFKLTYGDVKELIENGLKIVNRYGALYKGHTWSANMVGADDYKFVFEELRHAIERRRAEFDAEIEKHKKQIKEG
jgi:hypothetical protein